MDSLWFVFRNMKVKTSLVVLLVDFELAAIACSLKWYRLFF